MKSGDLDQNELFKPLTRTERQKEALHYWIKNSCKGTFEFPTGLGKTFTAIMGIKILVKKYPDLRVIVVVPTDLLQQQWKSKLDSQGLSLNCQVIVINTVIKYHYDCDFLVIDEIHRTGADQFSKVFDTVKYKYILGLTATLERLDGRHLIIEKYCPVVDSISPAEAVANGWMAKNVEYKIILNVPDIERYLQLNKEFNEHFEFFNNDFPLAMSLVGPKGLPNRLALRDKMVPDDGKLTEEALKQARSVALKNITYHATALMRVMQARKKFINTHPDKIRLTQEIIKHRPNAKIITFAATIDMANKIGTGFVYTGKDTKKKGQLTIDEFAKMDSGVLNTVAKANEGLDCPGLSVAIILGMDSSPTKYIQRKGRVIRKEGDKIAEIFTFVINYTVETEWFTKSHKDAEFIPIDEENLMHVLKGEPFKPYKRSVSKFTFRF